MANNMKIDTGAIQSAASTIKSQNDQLLATLQQSQATVDSLRGVWQGAAAEATVSAYDSFAKKYFEQYHEMLDQYVGFLNNSAGEGYSTTEQNVTRKADQI